MIVMCENGPLRDRTVRINLRFSERTMVNPTVIRRFGGTSYLLVDAWWDEIDEEWYGTMRTETQ